MKVSKLNKLHPNDCEVLAEVRIDYDGYNFNMDRGYILYHLTSGSAYEHRLVAERVYGDIDGLVIHHKDENPTNNAASNLEPLTRAEHALRHKPPRVETVCPRCGVAFMVKQSQVERWNKNYCSLNCTRLSNRVVERPSKIMLVEQLINQPNYLELGRQYGVSDNAIRKWCKQYGIPHLSSYWRSLSDGQPIITRNN